MAAKRELFFLHCMANNERVNAAAFAANHLKQVGYASTGDISVGGMITQIADHFGYGQLLMEESAVTTSAPSVGDNVQNDQDFLGDEMEEDDRPEEQFVPPPQD